MTSGRDLRRMALECLESHVKLIPYLTMPDPCPEASHQARDKDSNVLDQIYSCLLTALATLQGLEPTPETITLKRIALVSIFLIRLPEPELLGGTVDLARRAVECNTSAIAAWKSPLAQSLLTLVR